MRILIAPDKFKGSLSAREVADNIALGLRDILPEVEIDIVPMADGGEGTAEVICTALGGTWQRCNVHNPLGRKIEARYDFIDDRKLAVMEMSEAAGMRLLPERERDPLRATTFGVGEMILRAQRHGAEEIIVGLGGSATNDGGFGMARALGFRFFTEKRARELRTGIGELGKLAAIDQPRRLSLPRIIAAADVRNPLLGQTGATRVFGPQKGASSEKVEILEKALEKLADVTAQELGNDHRNELGAGAAGGLGFGLMSFCGATIRSGFDVVAETVGLESKIRDADIVITGEGSLDRQTLEGKTPAGVAQLARKFGKRVFTIVGRATDDQTVRQIFDGVLELGGQIPDAPELLKTRARQLGQDLNQTSNAN